MEIGMKEIAGGVFTFSILVLFSFLSSPIAIAQQSGTAMCPGTHQGDYIIHDFHFLSGESMKEVRMHYTTLGKPERNASGVTTNAVLILHGTGGSGGSLLRPIFAGVLFGPGQLLDATKYYIILPD